MDEKVKKILIFVLNFRIIILLFAIILSIFAIHPFLKKPNFVRVEYYDYNLFGFYGKNLFLKGIYINSTYYKIESRQDLISLCPLNGTKLIKLEFLKEKLPYFYEKIESKEVVIKDSICNHLEVSDLLFSYLRFSSDIEGGLRAIIKVENSSLSLDEIVEILQTRFDVFGVKQIKINKIVSGNEKYIFIEIPGGGYSKFKELIEKKGYFYAKIINDTVFTYRDVVFVCKNNPSCSYIYKEGNTYLGMFEIEISKEAAKRLREILDKYLKQGYKELYLELYLDEKLITKLLIAEGILREKDYTKLTKAYIEVRRYNKEELMLELKRLQAILSSKPINANLKIVNLEIINPKLGFEFFKNLTIIFLLSIVIVDLLLFLFYRDLKITIAMSLISLSEILITLGLYALGNWTIDIASLVALVAAVGLGVDDQITIVEEAYRKREEKVEISEKVRKAFFIVMVSYVLNVLMFMPMILSAELFLKSFAFTSIITLTVGYFITRPAFAEIVRIIKE